MIMYMTDSYIHILPAYHSFFYRMQNNNARVDIYLCLYTHKTVTHIFNNYSF